MSEADDYRASLEVCWRMAAKATNERERRAWLDMAESWKLLVITADYADPPAAQTATAKGPFRRSIAPAPPQNTLRRAIAPAHQAGNHHVTRSLGILGEIISHFLAFLTISGANRTFGEHVRSDEIVRPTQWR
jgi:hypothetical protein